MNPLNSLAYKTRKDFPLFNNQIETGKPIWEITREYLQNNKIYSSQDNEKPRILGESDNLGATSS